MEALDDMHGPEAQAVATLARRVAAIDWFAPRWRMRPASRIDAALEDHVSAFALPRPASLRLLSGPAGRAALNAGAIDLGRRQWSPPLLAAAARAGDAIRLQGLAPRRPLLDRSGEAILVNLAALPIPRLTLMRRLAGTDRRGTLRPPVVEALADRIAWELGTMLAWTLAGAALPANPFLSFLGLYEEAILPLDLTPDAATLWLPGEE